MIITSSHTAYSPTAFAFRKCTNFLYQSLVNEQLNLSSPTTFNDPFDCPIRELLNNGDDIKIADYVGNVLWKYDYQNHPVKNPYEQEHVHLVESIRLEKKINQAEDLAYSTQVAILGRESAYTGKSITWDEIMASTLRYGPEKYEMGALPFYKEGEVPKPGKAPVA